jgi:chorismate mutase
MTTDKIIDVLNNLNEMDLTAVLEGLKYHLEEHSDHPDLVKKVFEFKTEDELQQEIDARQIAENEVSDLRQEIQELDSDLSKANKTIQEIKNLLN